EALDDVERLEKMAHVLGTQFPEGVDPTNFQREVRREEQVEARFKRYELGRSISKRADQALAALQNVRNKSKNVPWILWKGIRLRVHSILTI
ncbi:MAG: hypothetical protein K2X47_18810, partial [Bdellovibrionales bacterium]|nr:hypothetical protein [Bdellovibrionales bacterium]